MNTTRVPRTPRRWPSVLGFIALVTPLIATVVSLAYVLLLLDAAPSGWLIFAACMIAPTVIVAAEFARMKRLIADDSRSMSSNTSSEAGQAAP